MTTLDKNNTVIKKQSYILSTSKLGQKALDLQQQYLSNISLDFLKKANIQPGMVAYDIGCGAGSMTVHLAKQVGPNGCVIALDVSEEQLNAAQKAVSQADLNNVQFVQADILNYETLPKLRADVVYSRFVLAHLSDSQSALENMYVLLRNGSLLAVQESTWETVSTNYTNGFLHEYRDAVIKFGQLKGLNYNIGKFLPSMSAQLPSSSTYHYEAVQKINLAEYKDLAILRFQEVGDKLVKAGVIDSQTLIKWYQALEEMPIDDSRYFVNLGNLTCVLVRKCLAPSVPIYNVSY